MKKKMEPLLNEMEELENSKKEMGDGEEIMKNRRTKKKLDKDVNKEKR